MVSVNPNPVQGFYFCDLMCMELPGLNNFPPHHQIHPHPSSSSSSTSSTSTSNSNSSITSGTNTMAFQDDVYKKTRKPYTITKSRESWTDQEHEKFLEALQLFDRDWKKIEAFVGSKTVIQIRSHAQKYFLKVQKNGTSERVPPPRPKRKTAHPYPHKAPKNVATQRISPFQSLPASHEPEYVYRPDSSSILGNPVPGGILTSSSYNTMVPVNMPQVTGDEGLAMHAISRNCCYSNGNGCTPITGQTSKRNDPRDQESTPRTSQTNDINDQGNLMRVMPDFAQVYSFIGSVFDPHASGHLQRLKQMDPINVETLLLLMRNLCVNLTSPKFEDCRRLFASYNVDGGGGSSGSGCFQMTVSAPNEVKG